MVTPAFQFFRKNIIVKRVNDQITAIQRYIKNLKHHETKTDELKEIKEEAPREPKRHQSAMITNKKKLKFLRNDKSVPLLEEQHSFEANNLQSSERPPLKGDTGQKLEIKVQKPLGSISRKEKLAKYAKLIRARKMPSALNSLK